MSSVLKIDIPDNHLQEILRIVNKIIPIEIEVLIFGSRTKIGGNQYRDVDLGLLSESKVSTKTILALYDAFEESNLPYIFDVVDLNVANQEFKEEALKNYYKLR